MTVILFLSLWTIALGIVCLSFILRKQTKAFKGLAYLVDVTCIAWIINALYLIIVSIRGGR